MEGKRGIYFSNRLHNAVLRYVTKNGSDSGSVNKILNERYGVSIDIEDYQFNSEEASRFQEFQDEELIQIISMFEEMPSGFHKIEELNFLIRRLNGTQSPAYGSPSNCVDRLSYIEFMESGFQSFSIDYIHRLILLKSTFFMGKNF